MRSPLLYILAIAVALALPITSNAQTATTYTVSPYSCGAVSSPFYCYGLPFTSNGEPAGSMWVDTYLTGPHANSGFVLWWPGLNLEQGVVNGSTGINTTVTSNGRTASLPTTVVVGFSGDTESGGTYAGLLTLNLAYTFSNGGGGRGGGGAGWHFSVVGGTVKITQ